MENDNANNNNIEQYEKNVISLQITSKISLEEKFKEYDGDNLEKDFSWEEPVGKEIW